MTSNNPMPTFSVVQVGPWPPPYGGVSVHIRRLHQKMMANGISANVYCPPWPKSMDEARVKASRLAHRVGGLVWFLEKGWKIHADIIHFHSGLHYALAIWASMFRSPAIVVTCHDQMFMEQWRQVRPHIRWALQRAVKSNKVRWIAVSENVKAQLRQLGVPESRIAVIPAFIPPPQQGEETTPLPSEIRAFFDSHSPNFSAYGWELTLDAEGVDLYGFDMCIDLLADLKPNYPKIGLVCCVPRVSLPGYFEELKSRVRQYGLEENVLFYNESLPEAYPLWQASDVYLRPTTTDGDAVAVREALSMGVPVVASDASPRPEGVAVFPKRDRKSFAQAVCDILQKKPLSHENVAVKQDDFFQKILEIYRELVKKKNSGNS